MQGKAHQRPGRPRRHGRQLGRLMRAHYGVVSPGVVPSRVKLVGYFNKQQWPPNAETPHGAWEFHEHLIPKSPKKPLRIWMEVGDQDLYNPNVMRDNMHDWV